MVEQMTPSEKEAYIKLGQEMYADMYEWRRVISRFQFFWSPGLWTQVISFRDQFVYWVWVHSKLHIYPLCGTFCLPWHRHSGTMNLNVMSYSKDEAIGSKVTWPRSQARWSVTASKPRLPPTTVRMNHERLPRHCVYRATSSMTSRNQIWHILNIASSFSAR
jgi:hypothetical protein